MPSGLYILSLPWTKTLTTLECYLFLGMSQVIKKIILAIAIIGDHSELQGKTMCKLYQDVVANNGPTTIAPTVDPKCVTCNPYPNNRVLERGAAVHEHLAYY